MKIYGLKIISEPEYCAVNIDLHYKNTPSYNIDIVGGKDNVYNFKWFLHIVGILDNSFHHFSGSYISNEYIKINLISILKQSEKICEDNAEPLTHSAMKYKNLGGVLNVLLEQNGIVPYK